jgi:ribonuclease D
MNYVYIQNQDDLKKWVEKMSAAPRITVDTEADSLHNYYEKVCLIQISFGENHLIIDPLAGLDLSDFFKVLAVKPLIFHTADYDLRMLSASFGFRPGREVFDVMIAAQLLGIEAIGYASLVERCCAVKLHKKDQKSDWSRRPLTPEQLQYASDDTRYLEKLADTFEQELNSKFWEECTGSKKVVSAWCRQRLRKKLKKIRMMSGVSKAPENYIAANFAICMSYGIGGKKKRSSATDRPLKFCAEKLCSSL